MALLSQPALRRVIRQRKVGEKSGPGGARRAWDDSKLSSLRLPLLSSCRPPSRAGAREPAWILLERAKAAFDERDLTAALDFLLDAVEAEDEFPEAEYWLGRVYAAGGQSVLAEQQYRRAMELSIFLRVPQQRFEIAYSLADLLLRLGKERRSDARAVLSGITDAEGASSPAENQSGAPLR